MRDGPTQRNYHNKITSQTNIASTHGKKCSKLCMEINVLLYTGRGPHKCSRNILKQPFLLFMDFNSIHY